MTVKEIEKYIIDKINATDTEVVQITSGKVHKELHLINAMPSCCSAMRNIGKSLRYSVLHDTPSHNSSTYQLEYYKSNFVGETNLTFAMPSTTQKHQRGYRKTSNIDVPTPCVDEVAKYLDRWNFLENYHLQEDALEKLFFITYPNNNDINDVLIKVAALNDFYSTNIFSVFPVAKYIVQLNIDKRLEKADMSLVDDIANGAIKSRIYSFASKYCSHHRPNDYPIFDNYVEKLLKYFRNRDCFSTFSDDSLRVYSSFKELILDFRKFYGLECYSVKEIDKYLWQLGKELFPKNYAKSKK